MIAARIGRKKQQCRNLQRFHDHFNRFVIIRMISDSQ